MSASSRVTGVQQTALISLYYVIKMLSHIALDVGHMAALILKMTSTPFAVFRVGMNRKSAEWASGGDGCIDAVEMTYFLVRQMQTNAVEHDAACANAGTGRNKSLR